MVIKIPWNSELEDSHEQYGAFNEPNQQVVDRNLNNNGLR
jgi:hypothetical protein